MQQAAAQLSWVAAKPAAEQAVDKAVELPEAVDKNSGHFDMAG